MKSFNKNSFVTLDILVITRTVFVRQPRYSSFRSCMLSSNLLSYIRFFANKFARNSSTQSAVLVITHNLGCLVLSLFLFFRISTSIEYLIIFSIQFSRNNHVCSFHTLSYFTRHWTHYAFASFVTAVASFVCIHKHLSE